MKRLNLTIIILLSVMYIKAQEIATLTISNCDITPNGYTTLTIESDIALNNYCSFQFDLLVPEGIVIPYNMNPDEEEEQFGYYDTEEEEWIPCIESGITKSSHTLACSAIEGGYRFVCYHPNFTSFKSGNKNVLTINLQANDEIANGFYRCKLGGTMFIANEDEHFIPNTITGSVLVKNSDKSVTYEFVMSEEKWGTLMLPFDAIIPAGITAYNCMDIDGENIILEESYTLYANTPYLLNGNPGTFSFTGIPNVEKNEYTYGCMTGVHSITSVNGGYVLQKLDGVLAFYKINEIYPIDVPAAHCYINKINDASYISVRNTTGIGYVTEENTTNDVYDINGIRVQDVNDNKVYIINNKKTILK